MRAFGVVAHKPSVQVGLQGLVAALPDLVGEHRTEAMPSEPDGLTGDLDALLVWQALDIPQRQVDADGAHPCQADDPGAALR